MAPEVRTLGSDRSFYWSHAGRRVEVFPATAAAKGQEVAPRITRPYCSTGVLTDRSSSARSSMKLPSLPPWRTPWPRMRNVPSCDEKGVEPQATKRIGLQRYLPKARGDPARWSWCQGATTWKSRRRIRQNREKNSHLLGPRCARPTGCGTLAA